MSSSGTTPQQQQQQQNVPSSEFKRASYGAVEYGSTSEASTTEAPKRKQHSVMGITFIMLGAFSFSVMFLLVKLMAETSTFTLVFYRSLVQIAISLATLLRRGEDPLGPPGETRFYLSVRGTFGAAAVCCWFFGIQVLPLPDAVTLQFTTPPFAAAFAVCMVGERWLPLDVIGAAVCLTGVAFIAHPTWLFGTEHVDGADRAVDPVVKALAVMVTTGGAALAGIAYVCVRKIGDRASAVVMVLYYGAWSIPMTVLGARALEGTWNVWTLPDEAYAKDYLLLLLMGLGGYGGQWFTNLGLQNETAATATLATSTQIVWTYLFEIVFLHEALNAWSMAGTGLIVGYMLIVAGLKFAEHAGGGGAGEEELLLDREKESFVSDYEEP